jgi:hypothetical protein
LPLRQEDAARRVPGAATTNTTHACTDAVAGATKDEEDLEPLQRIVGERVVEAIAGELEVGQWPTHRERLAHCRTSPAPCRKWKQPDRRVDARSPRHGERGTHDGDAVGGLGDGADALPVDGVFIVRGSAHDRGDVGDPHETHEAVVRLTGMRGDHHQLYVLGQDERGRTRDDRGLTVRPHRNRIESRDALRRRFQPEVELEEQRRHLGMGEDGVVLLVLGRPHECPSGSCQRRQCTRMVGAGEQQVDVLHWA